MRILTVGPSPDRSKGGMATVIQEIRSDPQLNRLFDLQVYESYIDGGRIKVLFYSVFAYLRFLFTKRNFDVYHIHMASRGSTFRKKYYLTAAKRWKKRVILHIHGAQYMEFYEELPPRKKRDVAETLKKADLVIALSEEWKRKFDSTFGLKNCVVLENGIDIEKLRGGAADPAAVRNSFLSLGRLGKRKGTYDLIEAVEIARRSVPDLVCYLAGDGEVKEVQELVDKKRLRRNIQVVGWADFKRKLELFSKTATVVLPSYHEGLPMAILEGMACGKAVISTTVGAVPEVIGEENGILIRPGDVAGLAEAMIRCCTDTEYLKRVSAANLRDVQLKYSMEAMHIKLSRYYRKVGNP